MSKTPRNYPLEMAQIQQERGTALTKAEFVALGYTSEQIDKHSPEAGRLFAQMANARAA